MAHEPPSIPKPRNICTFVKHINANIFLSNLYRELLRKSLQHSRFLLWNRLTEPRNRQFPVKFPNSRELGRRRVRCDQQCVATQAFQTFGQAPRKTRGWPGKSRLKP